MRTVDMSAHTKIIFPHLPPITIELLPSVIRTGQWDRPNSHTTNKVAVKYRGDCKTTNVPINGEDECLLQEEEEGRNDREQSCRSGKSRL